MMQRIVYVEVSRDGTVEGSHVSLLRLLTNLDRERFDSTVFFHADHHIAAEVKAMDIGVLVLPNEAPVHLASLLGTRVPGARASGSASACAEASQLCLAVPPAGDRARAIPEAARTRRGLLQ